MAGKEGMLGSVSSRACWRLPAQALLPLDCTGNVWGREGWGEQGKSEEIHLLPQLLSAFGSPPPIPSVFSSLSLCVPQGKDGKAGKGRREHICPTRDPVMPSVTPSAPSSRAEGTPANPELQPAARASAGNSSTSPRGRKQRNHPWAQSCPERGWWETLPHLGISSAPSLQPVQLCPILASFVLLS